MKNFLILLILSFILNSCAVTNYHKYAADPIKSRSYIELKLNDIELLGETEISYEFSRYLFIGTRLIAINGEQPDNSEKHFVSLPFTPWQQFGQFFNLDGGGMNRALYKVYTQFPNADYIDIISTNEKSHNMFLGRKVKRTSIVRAYKYRYR